MDRPTSVYIIECAGYVKIGVAVKPSERLKAINTGTPAVATLYRAREFEGSLVAYNIETRMHRYFAKHRGNGEWFRVEPAAAWAVLSGMRERKVLNADKRHDNVDRWADDPEDENVTDLLFEVRA